MSLSATATISVSVIQASSHEFSQRHLKLAEGSTVGDALLMVEFAQTSPVVRVASPANEPEASESFVGVWGKRVRLSQVLVDGDRIELYRPILADAKSARKSNAIRQGYRAGRTKSR
ncbi:MAG: RnfH family protein [Betaproteobacteria bacterium]|nr:MAG: RnfH family protein [Betaproteobacteria bacterium]TAG45728.1 MAG: RnfH family protein [Betaproteobacteria bacterium]